MPTWTDDDSMAALGRTRHGVGWACQWPEVENAGAPGRDDGRHLFGYTGPVPTTMIRDGPPTWNLVAVTGKLGGGRAPGPKPMLKLTME